MGRGTSLSATEKVRVDQLEKLNWSPPQIAKEINWWLTAVRNYLTKSDDSEIRQKRRQKPKLTVHHVIKFVARFVQSVRVKKHCAACQYVEGSADPNLEYSMINRAPSLMTKHKTASLFWCSARLHEDARWCRRTVISDEKRLCLDGPTDRPITGEKNVCQVSLSSTTEGHAESRLFSSKRAVLALFATHLS